MDESLRLTDPVLYIHWSLSFRIKVLYLQRTEIQKYPAGPDLSNQRNDPFFECRTVPSLSPHLSVAPTSCPGRARYCGLGHQPSAVVGAHPQR